MAAVKPNLKTFLNCVPFQSCAYCHAMILAAKGLFYSSCSDNLNFHCTVPAQTTFTQLNSYCGKHLALSVEEEDFVF